MLRRLFLLSAAAAAVCAAQSGGFRAAVVKVDITPSESKWLAGYPPRQSTGVHDRIWHRVVALDDGRTQFFLVASDFCLFTPSVYDETAALLEKEAGIEPVRFWWSVTHTHSAPEVGPHGMARILLPKRYAHDWDRPYTAHVQRTLVDAVKQARAKLEPARLAVGTGFAMANINRRGMDDRGRVSLGLNPAGPTDRQIGLLRIERRDGSPMALVANYAMHGTALGPPNTLISGDAPGVVAAYVEEKLGIPVLYVNGAAGNLAPIYTVQPDFRAAHIDEFKVLLGDRIVAGSKRLPGATADVRLRAGQQVVHTERKPDFGWDETLKDYLPQSAPSAVRLPVRFLFINDDTAIYAAPVELFCEISNGIRGRSRFQHTFFFGYTNGWLGYLCTRKAYEEGGYEPGTAPFTEQVEDDFTQAVTTYLEGAAR